MPYLIAALTLVGVLAAVNLLLTYGVIRRLREHTELLSLQGPPPPPPIAEPGSTIGSFAATTVGGDEVTEDDLAPGAIVGFFSPGCRGCMEQIPEFLDAARSHPDGARGALAVVIGPNADAKVDSAGLVAALASAARVVIAQQGDGIEEAFRVTSFPAFVVMGGNRVVRSSGGLRAVASVGVVA